MNFEKSQMILRIATRFKRKKKKLFAVTLQRESKIVFDYKYA